MKKKIVISTFVFYIIAASSCNNILEFSPYDSNVKNCNHNNSEIGKIQTDTLLSDTFKFAVISDTHESYDGTKDAIKSINNRKGLQFVLCCGDVANGGLAQEYKWYFDGIKKCNYPVITIIGNHDYRSNGKTVYMKMFGSTNSSFVAGAYKFILFDDIVWENGNKSPVYEWLIDQLADTSHHNIVVAHIPPWSDQMEGLNNLTFQRIVKASNTILCLHGHTHSFYDGLYNGIRTIVSGDIDDGEYLEISMVGSKAIVEHIKF